MPVTDYQGSFGRSMLSPRSDLVKSAETIGYDADLESFQRLVSDRFSDLSSAGGDDLLSLTWIGNLLDSFLCCHEEFRIVVFNRRLQLIKPPMDRLTSDYFDRSVKALDVCNAIRDGIEQIRQWQKLIEIVICSLDTTCAGDGSHRRSFGEGQLRRAKKALVDLAIGMLDEKDSSGVALAHRNRSFTRNSKDSHQQRHMVHFRSLSWSMSRSWSASKQLQAIGNNLSPPRASDIMATDGLAVAMYTMNSILVFVMWALVAAIPCQDRGLHIHFYIPRQFQWAAPVMSLHDRILEEAKRKDKKNICGLLREIYQIERSSILISELAESVQFPLTEEKQTEVKHRVEELVQVCGSLKDGLDPIERQVRDVFHRIVRSRSEGLDSLGKAQGSV